MVCHYSWKTIPVITIFVGGMLTISYHSQSWVIYGIVVGGCYNDNDPIMYFNPLVCLLSMENSHNQQTFFLGWTDYQTLTMYFSE